MNGLADEENLRLRFDVLTKTKQPELHRYETTRDRAAHVRLYRLAAEILAALHADVVPAAGRLAPPGLPGTEPVLGVGVTGGQAQRREGVPARARCIDSQTTACGV
jgi:hypothetical protein